jgi:hypothetical protein
MTVSTTAFAVIHDDYDCYSVFEFAVIVDKLFRTSQSYRTRGLFSVGWLRWHFIH